jgi:hypothetical protein
LLVGAAGNKLAESLSDRNPEPLLVIAEHRRAFRRLLSDDHVS